MLWGCSVHFWVLEAHVEVNWQELTKLLADRAVFAAAQAKARKREWAVQHRVSDSEGQ